MVLTELGTKITGALSNIFNSPVIDEEAIDKMLKEIAVALLSSDVNVQLVKDLRTNIKAQLNFEEIPSGLNKRKLIEQAVFTELCKLLDPGNQPYQLVKGKPNIIMFVGLQGSGKTTSIAKLAYYYKRKGWKVCLVCADTFRAGAFDQLAQNAHKIKIPYYGSHVERDPVKLAAEGVETFKKDGFELIFVDTSGRHKQEKDLFDEMAQIAQVIKPDEIIFTMDGSIGQAAFDQATAFKQTVPVGSVIITKLDGHAKGGGALSAVAATKSPIIFIGTGEHVEDLELFNAKSFVGKLLGLGDLPAVFQKFNEVITKDKQKEMAKKISAGTFTLRDMYEQLQYIMQMGPVSQIMDMIPGLSHFMNQIPNAKNVDVSVKFKSYMVIMDSMTDTELDDPKVFQQKTSRESRVVRIARGSGRSVREVNELLDQYKYFGDMIKKMGDTRVFGKDGNINLKNLMNNPMMKNMPIGKMGNKSMGINMQSLLKMASQTPLGKMMGGMPGMPGMPGLGKK